MAKEVQFNFRMTPELRQKIEDYVRESRYENMTDFITDAILEKIDPEIKMREFKKLILASRNDPDIAPLLSPSSHR